MRSTLSQIGKYELRSVLARTATSIVYDGWDSDIARRVAVKAVPLSALEDSDTREALARFKRGVQAAGQLTHHNIVNVYDYGQTDDYAYIVMEFVDGVTLKEMLDAGQHFDIRSLCKIMNGILEGLQYSHDRGVVHRDMKPANIMFTADQRVKITDFGIARLEDTNMTQTGMVIGTPAYMSPEQFMGEKIDWRSDIYSTGVVLYHMITGVRPYDGNLATIMNKVLNSPVPRPSGVSPMVLPALDEIIARAMAKKCEDRFQSAADFNAAIQGILVRPEAPRRPIGLAGAGIGRAAAPLRPTAFWRSPVFVGVGIVMLAAGGLGVTRYLRSGTASRPGLVSSDAVADSGVTNSIATAQPAPEVKSDPPSAMAADQTPGAAASGPQLSTMAPLDPERPGGGDVASLAGPTPQPEQPEISPIERPILPGFSRPVDTPLPRKSADAVSRPPKQPAATKSGPGTVRQTLESGSLRETLNRLSNGVASPNTPGAAHTENNLQSPPQYPTFSTSAVGLFCQTVTSDTAHDLGLETPRGLWCTGVAAGSAAAIAGIRTNDILLTINGSEMRDLSGLGAIASASAPGRLIPVEILRHGNKKTVQLQIDQLRH